MTTTIRLYINFGNYFFYSYEANATIVTRIQVFSVYSGTSVPANNTIVPGVTLTNPNGTEESSLEMTLNNILAGYEYCHDELQNTNHRFTDVQANIHSPDMYSQLGEHNFTIKVSFFSPESVQLTQSLQSRTDTHTLIVNITTTGMSYCDSTDKINNDNCNLIHLCLLFRWWYSTATNNSTEEGRYNSENWQNYVYQ